jgi:hypothetical protein
MVKRCSMDAFSTALAIAIMAWIALPLAYVGVRTLIDALSGKDGWIDVICGLALIVVSSLASGVLLLLLSKRW